jgi:hypothetical protein
MNQIITTPMPLILFELAYPWFARGIPVAVSLSVVTELIPDEVTLVTVVVWGMMPVYDAEVPRILAGIALPIPLLVQGLGICIVTVFGRASMFPL